MTEKKLQIKWNKIINKNIPKYKKKIFVVVFKNHNLWKTEFKVKSCSEALILNHMCTYIKAIYILCLYRDTCYILFSISFRNINK